MADAAIAIAPLLEAVAARLDDTRQQFLMDCKQLLSELTPQLALARTLESEFGRYLAPRFNVLDYLRDNEYGLSRIIAALLDPRGTHGQGPLFLRKFLEGIPFFRSREALDLEGDRVSVSVEKVIADQRRIDIAVHIVTLDGIEYGLAIENKPYAADQEDQVSDYLTHLEERYEEGKFVLVYLSPKGEGPSEWSIREEQREKYRDRLVLMAYCGRNGQNEQHPKSPCGRDESHSRSLDRWLGTCRVTTHPILGGVRRIRRARSGRFAQGTPSGFVGRSLTA